MKRWIELHFARAMVVIEDVVKRGVVVLPEANLDCAFDMKVGEEKKKMKKMMVVRFFSADVSCLFRQYEATMRRCSCLCIFEGVVLDRDSKAVKISVGG